MHGFAGKIFFSHLEGNTGGYDIFRGLDAQLGKVFGLSGKKGGFVYKVLFVS